MKQTDAKTDSETGMGETAINRTNLLISNYIKFWKWFLGCWIKSWNSPKLLKVMVEGHVSPPAMTRVISLLDENNNFFFFFWFTFSFSLKPEFEKRKPSNLTWHDIFDTNQSKRGSENSYRSHKFGFIIYLKWMETENCSL